MHTLDKSQLKGLKTDFQRMTIDRKDPDRKPSFFASYSSLPEPDYSIISQVRSSLEREDTCFTRPANRARQVAGCWSYYIPYEANCNPGEVLWPSKEPYKDMYQNEQPEFGTFKMTDIPGKGFPRAKAEIYTNLNTNYGEILCGELLTILRLMLGQLSKARLLQHMKAPIILSFMGKRARTFESYFDGQALVLRTTKLYNFPEETSIVFNILTECYLSSPAGNAF
ncbi:hypothetical protein N7537_004814 [Penicillium hordei]|uniref:Uncharacterized protein n=1 Tax=Penicillium hordei TaxID=40994 RepID=A0AAD6EBZ8_9EURO|nr:uncharacterized protein N7537_004814 [Penicillium hordei]KAJ5608195.1 hypothetical protein N7537_004814 [Penicillium hordei]